MTLHLTLLALLPSEIDLCNFIQMKTEEIYRDVICKHTEGTNYFLNVRDAKNNSYIGLLTEVLIMRLNNRQYLQEERLRHPKPPSEMFFIVYTPI
jgi:hypothetical protein